MTYTKDGWIPVTTELNDIPIAREETFLRGEYDRILHRDWCEDLTCWCKRQPKE